MLGQGREENVVKIPDQSNNKPKFVVVDYKRYKVSKRTVDAVSAP